MRKIFTTIMACLALSFAAMGQGAFPTVPDDDTYPLDNDSEYTTDNNSEVNTGNVGKNNTPVHIIGERTKDNPHVSKFNVTNNNLSYVLSTPLVDTSFKVYDFAGVLPKDELQAIEERCHEFKDRTGLDIAIVTLNKTDHQAFGSFTDYEEYIIDFYDYNDFGRDGVMLAINLEYDRNSIFDAGKPNSQSFMASKPETYGPEMRAMFDQKEYFSEIMYFIDHTEEDWLYESSFPVWKCLIFGGLLGLIVFFVHRSKYQLVFNATSANNYKSNFTLTKNDTQFVRSYTTKVYNPPSSSGSGGGSGSSGGGHSGGSF